jgi:hypothetical protein
MRHGTRIGRGNISTMDSLKMTRADTGKACASKKEKLSLSRMDFFGKLPRRSQRNGLCVLNTS